MIKKLFIVSAAILAIAFGQSDENDGAIAFPMAENAPSGSSKEENIDRLPMYMPSRCGVNELLYPGDQDSDWICDCAPGHIYVPDADMCHAVYTRGACKEGQYLVLQKRTKLPKCIRNKCVKDGEVWFRKQCWKLDEAGGPCKENHVLSVNARNRLGCFAKKFPTELPTTLRSDHRIVTLADSWIK